jgi:hypothetical protein
LDWPEKEARERHVFTLQAMKLRRLEKKKLIANCAGPRTLALRTTPETIYRKS